MVEAKKINGRIALFLDSNYAWRDSNGKTVVTNELLDFISSETLELFLKVYTLSPLPYIFIK